MTFNKIVADDSVKNNGEPTVKDYSRTIKSYEIRKILLSRITRNINIRVVKWKFRYLGYCIHI